MESVAAAASLAQRAQSAAAARQPAICSSTHPRAASGQPSRASCFSERRTCRSWASSARCSSWARCCEASCTCTTWPWSSCLSSFISRCVRPKVWVIFASRRTSASCRSSSRRLWRTSSASCRRPSGPGWSASTRCRSSSARLPTRPRTCPACASRRSSTSRRSSATSSSSSRVRSSRCERRVRILCKSPVRQPCTSCTSCAVRYCASWSLASRCSCASRSWPCSHARRPPSVSRRSTKWTTSLETEATAALSSALLGLALHALRTSSRTSVCMADSSDATLSTRLSSCRC
mmetsp:Transcript_102571/g.290085  ORF Transcript_102571/g.290085 Transcript_102571/m.290085 type:complete len:291 (+) Transcript_102571:1039-1911(+)